MKFTYAVQTIACYQPKKYVQTMANTQKAEGHLL